MSISAEEMIWFLHVAVYFREILYIFVWIKVWRTHVWDTMLWFYNALNKHFRKSSV